MARWTGRIAVARVAVTMATVATLGSIRHPGRLKTARHLSVTCSGIEAIGRITCTTLHPLGLNLTLVSATVVIVGRTFGGSVRVEFARARTTVVVGLTVALVTLFALLQAKVATLGAVRGEDARIGGEQVVDFVVDSADGARRELLRGENKIS